MASFSETLRTVVLALCASERRDELEKMFRRNGWDVIVATDGDGLHHALTGDKPDGYMICLRLPGADAWEALRSVRRTSDAPVILTAPYRIQDEAERAYSEGADDYLTLATGLTERLARVWSRFRRIPQGGRPTGESHSDGWISLDPDRREAAVNGRPVQLSTLEYDLLTAFVRTPKHVLSTRQLLDQAWPDHAERDPAKVRYAVLRLRRKIEQTGGGQSRIATVRGAGYRYDPLPSRS